MSPQEALELLRHAGQMLTCVLLAGYVLLCAGLSAYLLGSSFVEGIKALCGDGENFNERRPATVARRAEKKLCNG